MKDSETNVISVSGKSLFRKQCRRIDGQYYEMNVDCFLMPDNRWHRKGNGKIEFDHEFKNYVLLDRTDLQYGIVNVDEYNKPIEGYFSSNPIKKH